MLTTVTILACNTYGAGRHAWDIPILLFEKIAFMAWLGQFSSLIATGATKISVLCFYRRIAKGTYQRSWKWAVFVAIGFTASWTMAFVLALIFNCSPTDAYWKAFNSVYMPTKDYTCTDTTVLNLLAGMFAALSDLYSVLLPCLMTRNFDLPWKQRIALNVVFSLGLIVVGASVVRTYFLRRKFTKDTPVLSI